jgi:hypothetical protein
MLFHSAEEHEVLVATTWRTAHAATGNENGRRFVAVARWQADHGMWSNNAWYEFNGRCAPKPLFGDCYAHADVRKFLMESQWLRGEPSGPGPAVELLACRWSTHTLHL